VVKYAQHFKHKKKSLACVKFAHAKDSSVNAYVFAPDIHDGSKL